MSREEVRTQRLGIWTNVITIILTTLLTIGGSIYVTQISKTNIINYEYKEVPKWDIKNTQDYYPLQINNEWIYEGKIKIQTTVKYREGIEKKVRLKMKIVDKIDGKNGVTLYVFDNYINNIESRANDFLDSDSMKATKEIIELPPEKTGLLLIANKLFLIDSSTLENVINLIKANTLIDDPKVDFSKIIFSNDGFFTYNDLHLEIPLFKGQRFGDVESITRSDLSYYWYVNDVIDAIEVTGQSIHNFPSYEIVFNTLADYQQIIFKPYLGITKSVSHHSGTLYDAELELINYSLK